MLAEAEFSKFEKNYLWLLIGGLMFAFFYQLGIYPLFLEEPRRGLIALEMMLQDNLWVPTQTGDLYFRKPPLYNWALVAAYRVFGVTEFATRFFSVLSHMLLGGVTYLFSRKYLTNQAAILVALSYLLSVDILVYFSALGEIDLFYALITSSSIFLIFHCGEKGRFYTLFITVYVLTALGFLTKGLSSLPFTAISLLVYFIWKRDFKRLLSLAHFSGIIVFSALLFSYFYKYSQYEDVSGWWNTLYSESADKAAGGGIVAWLNHLISFPLDTLKNLIPGTLVLPLLFSKKVLRELKGNRLVWFALLIFIFNFLIYWFSTEGRSRYVYPIFPFACVVLIAVYLQSDKVWKQKYLKYTAFILLGILTLGFAAIPFLGGLEEIDGLWVISIVGVLLLAVLIVCLSRQLIRPYLVILGLLVVLRLGFSAIVPQSREKTTGAARDKALGIELAELTKGERLRRLGDVRISLTVVFYLERERGSVLNQVNNFEEGFYLCYASDLPESHKVIREFDYRGEPIFLIEYYP